MREDVNEVMEGYKRMGKGENKLDLLDELLGEAHLLASRGERISFRYLLEKVLNEMMKGDRNLYLKLNPYNRANGFYSRKLNLSLGELNLQVPRVRYGNRFRPSILPPRWQRVDKDYEELLVALLANGYNKNQIERTVRKLGLPFSYEDIQDLEEFIQEHLSFFNDQLLESDWFAVFVDAYHTQIRGPKGALRKGSLFTFSGIDLEARKRILGFWVKEGNENKGLWQEVLQSLIKRGSKRVLVFVTDNFSGLGELISKLFPLWDHQFCMVHLARNLRRKLTRARAVRAMKLWHKIKAADSYEEAREVFEEMVAVVQEEKPAMAKKLAKDIDGYLVFKKYPEEVRSHIYTTNPVESINAGLEDMRNRMGGYWGSMKALEVNLFIQFANLQSLWDRKPMAKVRSKLYEIRQLFTMRFELDEMEEGVELHNF